MAPKFIFFDNNIKIISAYKKKLSNIDNISIFHEDLDEILSKHKIDMIVSPANSFGRMTGGIDYYYAKKFPKVENNVKQKIAKKKYAKSKDLGYFLPVGMAVIVKTDDASCPYLIASPTMFMANSNIDHTNNIYLAFSAILKKIDKLNLTVACPGLGTGVAGIDPQDSAKQIFNAFYDHYNQ